MTARNIGSFEVNQSSIGVNNTISSAPRPFNVQRSTIFEPLIHYKMRGYSGSQYIMWVSISRPVSTPPQGTVLTDVSIVDVWSPST